MYGVLLPPTEQEAPPLPTNGNNPDPMSLAPPPPGEFENRDDLLEFLKDWGEHQGFAVVIGRSRPNRLWIKCDRGGEYADKHLHDPENRKRKRKATRLTGCPFNVKATMKKDKIWRCFTENPQHNHPPSEDLSVHPSLRRMTDEQLAKVNDMTEAGKTPVETLDELQRLWPGIKVLRRDIYNARKKYKTEKELAEIAQGMHVPQPYEDPNGKMPGPTRTGRWEWLEDGDEVKRKKKKKSISAAPATSTAGAEIREPESPQPSHLGQMPRMQTMQQQAQQPPARPRQTPGLASLPPRPYQANQTPRPTQLPHQPPAPPSSRVPDPPDFGSTNQPPSASPRHFRAYNALAPTPPAPRAIYRAPSTNASVEAITQPSLTRGRSINEGAPMAHLMAPMVQTSSAGAGASNSIPASASASAGGGPKQPSGQVLMSRIERMEREQNEQKQMLAQILSAVQGVGTLRR